MEQYIPKAAVVAEIERRIKSLNKDRDFNYLQIKELEALLSSLDALEAKEADFGALSALAEHLIACDAHGITPKYRDGELGILEGLANNKAQKGE